MKRGIDFDQLYPGRFVKAGDLKGKDVTLAISDVNIEELEGNGGKKGKGIVAFSGAKKGLVLNRTNGECLKAMFGRKVDEWIGKRVTLYAAEFEGEPCIRIKGSPDIASPVTFELKLPRKKPRPMTMQKTGGNGVAKPAPVETPADPPAAEPIVDTETGEVF